MNVEIVEMQGSKRKNMIKTSIIVPVYNTAEYLRECFTSVFIQTQKEIEVIAINDGSTDNSLFVLEEIKKEHPELIIISQENKGLGSARNKGIELAKGEYIYFLDSDDCLTSAAMEVCYEYARQNQLDMVMFDAMTFGDVVHKKGGYDRRKIISEKEQVMSGEEFAEKYWPQNFYPSACLVYSSASLIRNNNLQFLTRAYYEDNEFHCKIVPLAERIMYIPRALYMRRYREESITTSKYSMRHANDYLYMIQMIHRQRHSKEMQVVLQKLKVDFLNGLLYMCMENELLENEQFASKFLKISLNICNVDAKNINAYYSLKALSHFCDVLPSKIVSPEIRLEICEKIQKVKRLHFESIPFKVENKYVGVYGTGKIAERFINEYIDTMGEIKAKIIFIDSNIVSGEKQYRGYNIFNVNDIGEIPLEYILIASSKYEEEMFQMIKEKYSDKFKVIRLKTDWQM